MSIASSRPASSPANRTPTTGRAVRAALTPAGKRKLTAAIKTYETAAATILDAALRPAEQQQMHDHVTRLLTTAIKGEPS